LEKNGYGFDLRARSLPLDPTITGRVIRMVGIYTSP